MVCGPAPGPVAIGIAAALVGVVEQVLLNPLTLLRARAIADKPRTLGWLCARRRRWATGLPLLLASQAARNAFSFGLHAASVAAGMPATWAGAGVGALDGAAFTPTRRVLLRQQLGSRETAQRLAAVIVRTEGWVGLWAGWPLNLARTAVGGAAYFGGIALAHEVAPTCHPAIAGALGTLAATLACNPLEVLLARFYLGMRRRPRWRVMWRGLGPSLLRTVPPKAVGYWAIQRLAGALAG